MVAGTQALYTDGINFTAEDLYYSPALKDLSSPGYGDLPFISANIKSKSLNIPSPKPYLIKEISLLDGRGIRVGLIGLANNEKSNYPSDVFEISDPLVVAKTIISEVRPKCDLLVVLADLSQTKAHRLALENGGIDLIITGDKIRSPGPAQKVNHAVIMSPANQGRLLGELRVYLDSKRGFARYENRYIPLDSRVPDDLEMNKLVVRSRAEISDYHKKIELAKKVNASLKQTYAGSETCGSCHLPAYEIWKKTNHAHAFKTLQIRNQEFNHKCLTCHTTGHNAEGGFLNIFQTPKLANVQCEVCHGPGLDHLQDPSKGLEKVGRGSCLRCHTSTDSPDFDFEKYWVRIRH